jgi:hypothetical protein
MVLRHEFAACATIGIDRADQDQALDARCVQAGQSFFHQRRMLLELVIGHPDQIHRGLQTLGRGCHRRRIFRVPGDDFRIRIVAEGRLERTARASDDPVVTAGRGERDSNALPDSARGAEQPDFSCVFHDDSLNRWLPDTTVEWPVKIL